MVISWPRYNPKWVLWQAIDLASKNREKAERKRTLKKQRREEFLNPKYRSLVARRDSGQIRSLILLAQLRRQFQNPKPRCNERNRPLLDHHEQRQKAPPENDAVILWHR